MASFSELAPGVRVMTLRNEHLEVGILPDKGSDIYSLVDRRTGVDVMYKSPWGARSPGPWSRPTTSMERWVEAYPGGWQLLLPNGGEECTQMGATWIYHGEAALLPWTVLDHDDSSASLETRLVSVPLRVRREISLEGPVLRIREVVVNESSVDLEVMWSHHPAFGAPLMEAGSTLSVGCRTVLADDRSPGTILAPASSHQWPLASAIDGNTVDLGQLPGPDEARSVLAYLTDFHSGYFAITNPRLRLGVGLRWPLEVFDKAWLWQEVHSIQGWPWYRQAYVVAVEPASTIPGRGMTNALAMGQHGVGLGARASREVVIEAVLFEGAGSVSGIDEGGAVRFARS